MGAVDEGAMEDDETKSGKVSEGQYASLNLALRLPFFPLAFLIRW